MSRNGSAHCAPSSSLPIRKFACGYYVWVAYLFRIEARIQAGIPVELTAADAEGLFALREARMRFDNEHPQCRCGRRMKTIAEKACGMCAECKDAEMRNA
jgi:hypothetical protein